MSEHVTIDEMRAAGMPVAGEVVTVPAPSVDAPVGVVDREPVRIVSWLANLVTVALVVAVAWGLVDAETADKVALVVAALVGAGGVAGAGEVARRRVWSRRGALARGLADPKGA